MGSRNDFTVELLSWTSLAGGFLPWFTTRGRGVRSSHQNGFWVQRDHGALQGTLPHPSWSHHQCSAQGAAGPDGTGQAMNFEWNQHRILHRQQVVCRGTQLPSAWGHSIPWPRSPSMCRRDSGHLWAQASARRSPEVSQPWIRSFWLRFRPPQRKQRSPPVLRSPRSERHQDHPYVLSRTCDRDQSLPKFAVWLRALFRERETDNWFLQKRVVFTW